MRFSAIRSIRALFRQRPTFPTSSTPNNGNRPAVAKQFERLVTRRDDGYKHFNGSNRRTATSPTFYYITGGLTFCGVVYYATHLERVPYSNRLRFMTMSSEEEMRLGEMTYLSILSSSPVLPSDDADSLYVNGIGKSIARQVKATRPELIKGFQWRFTVIDEPYTSNAMCMPGGKVVVYSGLLNLATRDELAAVLSHEIAHAVCRHSAEKISFMKLLLVLQLVVNMVFDFGGFTHLAGQLLGSLPYSRKLEIEADQVGLQLMANSCYNPHAAISFFQKLEAQEKQLDGGDQQKKPSKAGNYLSTHPMFSDRIDKMNEQISKFSPAEYELKCGKRFNEWKKAVDDWSTDGHQWSSA